MRRAFTDRISDSYSEHADSYVSVLEQHLAPLAERMAKIAELAEGRAALDLATGSGLIARALVPAYASVIGADISMRMLRVASDPPDARIHYVAANAHTMPLRDQCVDLVTCGLSLSHFADIRTALAEVRRLLRPGGRFITSAWGLEGRSPTKEAAVEVRRKYLEDRERTLGGAFDEELWADTARGSEALRMAGFKEVRVTTSVVSGRYRDHEQAIDTAFAWPITRYRIAQLAPDEQENLKRETASAVRQVSDLSWSSEVHYYEGARPE